MANTAELYDEEPAMVMVEGLPGDNEDLSGFDPMDYGDQQPPAPVIGDIAQEFWTEEDANNLNLPDPTPAPAKGGESRPQPKPDNAIQARLRIAERENKIFRERLDYILASMAKMNQPQEEEEEEEEITPFEDDPLTHVSQKVDKLGKQLERSEEEKQRQAQVEYAGKLLSKADDYTNEAIAKIGPDTWNAAMMHLANVRIEDYLERNPNYTREEASKAIGAAIVQEKIRMVHEGRNPAEVYLRDAVRFGFAAAQPKATPAPKSSPRTQIQEQNAKDKLGGKSIASVGGAPARARLSAQATLGMDDRLFREVVDDAIRDKGGRGLSVRDFIQPN